MIRETNIYMHVRLYTGWRTLIISLQKKATEYTIKKNQETITKVEDCLHAR